MVAGKRRRQKRRKGGPDRVGRRRKTKTFSSSCGGGEAGWPPPTLCLHLAKTRRKRKANVSAQAEKKVQCTVSKFNLLLCNPTLFRYSSIAKKKTLL